MTDPVLARHRSEILRLARRHGALNVRVFGSRAGRHSTEASDLDLLVALEDGRSLLDLIGLQQALEELTHLDVDVVTDNGLSPYLRADILRQAVPL
jgi:predicted nucleotidyltransferase